MNAHAQAHPHAHGTTPQGRLRWALVLAAAYMLAEVVGGWWTGSLALLADAGHMLSDVFALSLSLLAFRLAQRPSTPQQTYGHHRTEILAALAHGVVLVGVAVVVVGEAVERMGEPHSILGGPMLAIASGGLAVNLAALFVLGEARRDNLNVRGAWLHVLSDALGSVGAMTAGALVWGFGWTWADPLASLLIAGLVLYSAWALLRDAVAVLMEWAPGHVVVAEVERAMGNLPGVQAVHDLHVWTIASGRVSLSGHVVVGGRADHVKLLQEVTDMLHERFGIGHSTIQIETEDFDEPGGVCFT
jgi:cobalt-zinc-cadmium efflux system protein